MTNILLDLELDELSLVDRPANQAATICLIKRDNTMNLEERKAYYMDKGMSEDEALKKAKEDMKKAEEPEVSKSEEEVDQGDLFLAGFQSKTSQLTRFTFRLFAYFTTSSNNIVPSPNPLQDSLTMRSSK